MIPLGITGDDFQRLHDALAMFRGRIVTEESKPMRPGPILDLAKLDPALIPSAAEALAPRLLAVARYPLPAELELQPKRKKKKKKKRNKKGAENLPANEAEPDEQNPVTDPTAGRVEVDGFLMDQ